jgi:flagellar biosynthesis component FlhA
MPGTVLMSRSGAIDSMPRCSALMSVNVNTKNKNKNKKKKKKKKKKKQTKKKQKKKKTTKKKQQKNKKTKKKKKKKVKTEFFFISKEEVVRVRSSARYLARCYCLARYKCGEEISWRRTVTQHCVIRVVPMVFFPAIFPRLTYCARNVAQ